MNTTRTQQSMCVALLLALAANLSAQTADDYVSQGRAFLAGTNFIAANAAFANAVGLAPAHPTANVFYAATRLMVLPSQPAGSNFLNRLCVPVAGRDIYNWRARLPADTNGVPLAPVGVNADEATALLRTNILPVLIAAEANLAAVTDTNFTLTLTSNETRTVAVTLDYSDLQLLRALLQAGEYFAYTTYSWNLDAQLAAVRALYTNDELNIERLLMDYPNLLTFATTNDLNAAQTAFLDGAARYLEASQFIRNRPANLVRLFNYDAGKAHNEEKFRLTLMDLTNSMSGVVPVTVDNHFMVFLPALFSSAHSLRSLLPDFHGSGLVLGTLPDPTFGGLIYGIARQDVESFLVQPPYPPFSTSQRTPAQWLEGVLAHHLLPIPTITPTFRTAGAKLHFPVNVAVGRGYVVQVSTNLLDWTDYAAFVAVAGTYDFGDPDVDQSPQRYYRIVDRTGHLPPPTNDNFENRTVISGLNGPVASYTDNATRQAGETNMNYGVGHSIWWTWTSPVSAYVAVVATPQSGCWPITIFTGTSLNSLTPVANDWGQVNFLAQAGVTYQIGVDTCWQDGGVQIVITQPPLLNVTSPPGGVVFTAPANILVSGSATDPDGAISKLTASDWSGLLNFQTASSSFAFWWTNVPAGFYYLTFSATDDVGAQTLYPPFRGLGYPVIVAPPNDDFANATPISGAPLVLTGSTGGGSMEPGEPNFTGGPGAASAWWVWTPTTSGPVTIQCTIAGQSSGSLASLGVGVFTGTTVSNLTTVVTNTPTNAGDPAQLSFTATAGTTYRVAVDSQSFWAGAGAIFTLNIIPTQPPLVTIFAPTNDSVFSGPTNVTLVATASDPDGSMSRVDFYGAGSWLGAATNSPYSMVWSDLGGGSYFVTAKATDNAGAFTYSSPVSFTVTVPPHPNDNFASRIGLTGSTVTTRGSNAGATKEPGEPYHWANTGGASVWWSWTAPASGSVTISTVGSTFDTILSVYTGTSLSALTRIVNDDDSAGNGASRVTFTAAAGTVYQIAVDGFGGATGNIQLNITMP